MSSKQPLPGEKHFTSSVFIITKETPRRVLLLHHKKLNSWLQPGGHIEERENPVEAAVRETKEETGIDISGYLKVGKEIDEYASYLPLPDYFLEEKIPPHKDKLEHYHLDLLYVVQIPHQELIHNKKESLNSGWFTKEEMEKLSMLTNARVLVREIFKKLN